MIFLSSRVLAHLMLGRCLLLERGAGHYRTNYSHAAPLLRILADMDRLSGESFRLLLKIGYITCTAHFVGGCVYLTEIILYCLLFYFSNKEQTRHFENYVENIKCSRPDWLRTNEGDDAPKLRITNRPQATASERGLTTLSLFPVSWSVVNGHNTSATAVVVAGK